MSAGPLNHIATLVEQQAAQLFQQYQQQLLALAQKPELQNALSFATQLLQGQFVQNIKDKLTQLASNLIQSRSALSNIQARQQAEQELEQELSQLKFDLNALASNVLGNVNVNDLLSNLNVSQLVDQFKPQLTQLAGQAFNSLVASLFGKRDLVSTALNVLGLNDVFQTIVAAGQGFVGQLTSVASQLLFASQQIWQQAQAVLGQLHSDLLNHAGQAVPLLQNAVAQLHQIISQPSSGKRSIQEFAFNVLGLSQVWETVQQVGSNAVAQLQQIATQLLFAGQTLRDQVLAIFNQLKQDLLNHTGNATTIVAQAIANVNQLIASSSAGKRDLKDFVLNALGLGQVWQTLQEAGANALNQLLGQGFALLAAGKDKLDQARQVLAELIQQLKDHTINAQTFVQSAVADINQVLAGTFQGGKRQLPNLAGSLVNLLGLNQVWQTIQAQGQNVVNQFYAIGGALLTQGKEVLNQARVILAQLVGDLVSHAGNSQFYIQNAIQALNQVIAGAAASSGKRDLASLAQNVIANLGFGDLVQTAQQLGGQFVSQLLGQFTQFIFAASEIKDKVIQVFNELKQNLANHIGDSTSLFNQAFAQVAALLKQ